MTDDYDIWGIKPSTGEKTMAFEPQSSAGNTTIGWGNFSAASGDTNIYAGGNINLCSKLGNSYSLIPYYKPGDSFSIDMYTAGFITNAGSEMWFTVPLDKPVMGVNSVSITTSNGFQVRQNNKYQYGSTAGTYAKPTKYYASFIPGKIGINVGAAFSNTTNTVNNNPCGIRAMITIKFS